MLIILGNGFYDRAEVVGVRKSLDLCFPSLYKVMISSTSS